MNKKKRPVFFGCDFDPNPDIDGLRRKILRFIETSGDVNQESSYDIFVKNLNNSQIFNSAYRLAGKYPCPEWLSATPNFGQDIYPEMYRKFIDEGGCLEYTESFGKYVASELKALEIPVTIGVDHCLTGGIIQWLSKQYDDLLVIVFDAHLDAIPPYIRNDMVGYMREHSMKDNNSPLAYEYYGKTFTGNYDTGSFLSYLMKGETLRGHNLMVFGTQDSPSPKLWDIKDERITQYLKEYEWLEKQGVIIKPLKTLNQVSLKNMSDIQGKLVGRNVYLSIDIDVLKGKIGLAARYGNESGLPLSKIFKLLKWLELSQSNLVGMDIMELDVNSLASARVKEVEVYAFMKNTIMGICTEAMIEC